MFCIQVLAFCNKENVHLVLSIFLEFQQKFSFNIQDEQRNTDLSKGNFRFNK